MTTWKRWVGGLALVMAGFGFSACGSDDEPEVDHEGLRMCCEIGAYCHPPAGVIADEQRRHCHDLGHADEPGACRAEYDSCMALCADNPDPEEHSCAE
jgi:hypothetical protein